MVGPGRSCAGADGGPVGVDGGPVGVDGGPVGMDGGPPRVDGGPGIPDGGPGGITISMIQRGMIPEDTLVTVRNVVVTALYSTGVWVQDPAGGSTYSGIRVYEGVAPTVALHDRVDVTGTYIEYFDDSEIELATITRRGTATIGMSGLPPTSCDRTRRGLATSAGFASRVRPGPVNNRKNTGTWGLDCTPRVRHRAADPSRVPLRSMRDAQPVALLQRGFVLPKMPPAGRGSRALAHSGRAPSRARPVTERVAADASAS